MRYGYGFFVKVGSEVEPEHDVRINDFRGGHYATMRCEVKGRPWETIPAAWAELANWCKINKYEIGYHQELERHLTSNETLEGLVLELLCPVIKK